MRRVFSRITAPVLAVLLPAASAFAQRPETFSNSVRSLITTEAPVIALTHVKLIDGTGAAARDDQTVVIENGRITAVGRSSEVRPPANAQVHDLTGPGSRRTRTFGVRSSRQRSTKRTSRVSR